MHQPNLLASVDQELAGLPQAEVSNPGTFFWGGGGGAILKLLFPHEKTFVLCNFATGGQGT